MLVRFSVVRKFLFFYWSHPLQAGRDGTGRDSIHHDREVHSHGPDTLCELSLTVQAHVIWMVGIVDLKWFMLRHFFMSCAKMAVVCCLDLPQIGAGPDKWVLSCFIAFWQWVIIVDVSDDNRDNKVFSWTFRELSVRIHVCVRVKENFLVVPQFPILNNPFTDCQLTSWVSWHKCHYSASNVAGERSYKLNLSHNGLFASVICMPVLSVMCSFNERY
jgi:hypothetical protein